MKLLLVSMSARVIFDKEGNTYLNHHFNENTIKRYANICDELTLFLRDSGIRCNKLDAEKKYNVFPNELANLVVGPNIYMPKSNFFNLKLRRKLKLQMEKVVKEADKVISTSGCGTYSDLAIYYAKKYNKPYMVMNGGFAFETCWCHGIFGKFRAPFDEIACRKNFKSAPYALYVTQYALQKRYTCNGKTLGCSDVEIDALENKKVEERLRRIENRKKKVVLGTAANLDEARKGQKYVIRALKVLKNKGYSNFEYQLIGAGSGKSLLKEAKKCGVESMVKIIGAVSHDKVNEWYDGIDIYIHPSITEGLCRSIVEAMSRACPVVCSNVGGNLELVDKQFLFKSKNVKEIANCLCSLSKVEILKKEMYFSLEKAKEFNSQELERRRSSFLLEFARGK